MKIHEWEIWHTYTTHLARCEDLEAAALLLVRCGLAECVVHRDGRAHWRGSAGEVATGNVDVTLHASGAKARITISPDDTVDEPTGYIREVLLEAAHFRFCELRVFGGDSELPPPYIRAYLGKCVFKKATPPSEVGCYVQVKLFHTGILVLEYRIISPSKPTNIDRFIDGGVNMFQIPFDSVDMSPGVVEHGTYAYYFSRRKQWPVHLRAGLAWLNRGHNRGVKEATVIHDAGDFQFRLATLTRLEGDEHDHTLASVFLTIAGTIAFLLARPRTGVARVLLGQREVPKWGTYWMGRPHVYLTRFENQAATRSENEQRYGVEFGKIMARLPGNVDDARRYLPESGRLFEDFGVYINMGLSLWVWSENGLRRQEGWADPNRGHLIYEHQSVMEVLEYGFMIHRSLFEASAKHNSPQSVIMGRRQLVRLRQQMARVSGYGEIRDLLEHGWTALGLPQMRELVQESLAIADAETALQETRSSERIGRVLTIGFGILAVPPVASDVIKPLWEITKWWAPSSEAGRTLFFGSIALVISLSVMGAVLYAMARPQQQNETD